MNKFQKIIFTLVLFLISKSYGQDPTVDPDNSQMITAPVGVVLMTRGTVIKVRKGNGEIESHKEGKIVVGDVLRTGKASMAKIRMFDETFISIGPQSEIIFNNFFMRSKNDRKASYDFLRGQLRAHFPIKASEGDLEIRTKTSSMGIRGTKLLMNVLEDSEKVETTQYVLLEGDIVVKNLSNGKMYPIKPGMHLVFSGKDEKIESESVQKLSDKRFKELLAPNLEESDEAIPLLPFYLFKEQTAYISEDQIKKASRGPASLPVSEEKGETINENKLSNPSWKRGLDELNSRLRENNKK